MSDAVVWREVKDRLAARAPEFVRWLFPAAEKCSAHEVGIGALDGAAGDSLKIVVSGSKAGVWRDFAGSDGGNNLLDLLLKSRGLTPADGLKVAAEWLGYALPVLEKKKKAGGKLEFVCAYDYRDAAGALVHQTVRFLQLDEDGKHQIDPKTGEPAKTFLQRRPAQQGMKQGKSEAKLDRKTGEWWLWTLEGIEPVLYRLPEIVARPGDEVWIVEGEKDADTLAAQGLLATTCPMGAGKWRASYTEALRGRRVILSGDSDEAGQKGMEKIGSALDPVCEIVERVNWAEVLAAVGIAERAGEKWDASKLLSEVCA